MAGRQALNTKQRQTISPPARADVLDSCLLPKACWGKLLYAGIRDSGDLVSTFQPGAAAIYYVSNGQIMAQLWSNCGQKR